MNSRSLLTTPVKHGQEDRKKTYTEIILYNYSITRMIFVWKVVCDVLFVKEVVLFIIKD